MLEISVFFAFALNIWEGDHSCCWHCRIWLCRHNCDGFGVWLFGLNFRLIFIRVVFAGIGVWLVFALVEWPIIALGRPGAWKRVCLSAIRIVFHIIFD